VGVLRTVDYLRQKKKTHAIVSFLDA